MQQEAIDLGMDPPTAALLNSPNTLTSAIDAMDKFTVEKVRNF